MSAKARISAVLIAAAVLSGATLAHAESAQPTQNQALQPDHKTLPWNDKARWSLKLGMTEPPGHGAELRDVQAGAYYHLTPSLRVGGAVSFGEQPIDDHANLPQPQAQAPRVKLETSFKF
jgi:hypothetical protein